MSLYLFLAALATTATARNIVLEQVPVLPDGWVKSNATVDFREPVSYSIALEQPRVDTAAIMDIEKTNGAHLSREKAHNLRAPNKTSVDSVVKWLKKENVKGFTHNHDMVHVRSTVGETEKLLNLTFAYYTYDNRITKLRTQQYSIPDGLADDITFIHPIANFMKPERTKPEVTAKLLTPQPAQPMADKSSSAAAQGPCAQNVTIGCIKELYGINYVAPDSKSPVRLGISGYLEEYASHADLRDFLQAYTNITDYDFTVEKINGGQDNGGPPGGEAMLDLEYTTGLAYPATVIYYSTGGRGQKLDRNGNPADSHDDDNEPYLEFINALLDKPSDQLPHVLSVSYGDDELSVPKEYAIRVCDAYGLLTKRGTTIIHSSGDGGATGGQKGTCRTRDGKNTKTTMPTFPAGCPWVTTVGGTTHGSNPSQGVDFSSGGFSYYFERPAWQSRSVAGYRDRLNGHLDGYYNAQGRGIPDVAAVADEFSIVIGGKPTTESGTSASAPLFAALVALVNDARLRAGKTSIGFLNEILYSDAGVAALADVTHGTSLGCDFGGGWPATEGWDAITGLGEPKNFQRLMDLLVAAK